MELPHLGRNCALSQCNQLDFLPVKCDACMEVFCIRHYRYESHGCNKAQDKSVQVPACPLCSEPVVGNRNELPDLAVSQHIDQYCKRNDRAIYRARKPKSNLQSCSFKSCKQKDLIYLECSDCHWKYCVKHRHPSDHSCPGPSMVANMTNNWTSFKGSCSTSTSSGFELIKEKAQQISRSGQAALSRLAQSNSGTSNRNRPTNSNQKVNALQGNINEQEALAIALSESRRHQNTIDSGLQNENEDLALARALHESNLEARNRTAGSKETCSVS